MVSCRFLLHKHFAVSPILLYIIVPSAMAVDSLNQACWCVFRIDSDCRSKKLTVFVRRMKAGMIVVIAAGH